MRTAVALMRTVAAVTVAAGLVISPSAPRATAQPPPRFPDLDSFTAVPPDDYVVTYLRGRRTLIFATPHNVLCSFEAPVEPIPKGASHIHCDGDLPGLVKDQPASDRGGAAKSCGVGTVDFSPSGSYEFLPYNRKCGDGSFHPDDFPYWSGRPLDVGQKTSYGGVTCAVGPDQFLACLDTIEGDHGFVLQPSGSWTF